MMRIGMNVWPGYEPLFLARHDRSLDEQEFRLVELSNASAVGRAFRNGTIEAACLTLDEVFYTLQDRMEPVIVFVMDQSQGADVLLARPNVKSLADLRGKRIGVEVSAVGAYMLTRALEKAGLTKNDVIPVYIPIDRHFSAYINGEVDAVVTFEPVRTKLLQAGAMDIFNSSMIPGEIVDVCVVRRDFLKNHPEKVAALRKAWFGALNRMREAPFETAKIMAAREKVTPEEFEASLKGLHYPDEQENLLLISGETPSLLEPARRLKEVMVQAGLLDQDISLPPLFEPSKTMSP